MRARLCGVGFWTPGHTELGPWLAGEPGRDEAARPKAALLPSRLRRRTAPLTKMSCDVIERAAAQAAVELSAARFVLSSAWGEMQTTVSLLGQLAEEQPQVSPTLFHNSVHNTATGYLSIALKNHEGSTAIGAGDEGLAAGLIESFTTVLVDGEVVILSIADESIPEPFEGAGGDAIALGLCLRPVADAPSGELSIACELGRGDLRECNVDTEIPSGLRHNPSRAIVPLCRAIAAGKPARVPLGEGDEGWFLQLEPEAIA